MLAVFLPAKRRIIYGLYSQEDHLIVNSKTHIKAFASKGMGIPLFV